MKKAGVLRVVCYLAILVYVFAINPVIPRSSRVKALNTSPKVMVVGDSITADNPYSLPNANGGWRKPLYTSLVGSGYTGVTFLGSQNLDNAFSSQVPAAMSGHEGYGGWTSCDFFSDTVYPDRVTFRSTSTGTGTQYQPMSWSIPDALTTYSPDVVDFYIGTNEYINKWWRLTDRTTLTQCEDYQTSLTRLFDAALNAPNHPSLVIGTIGVKGFADDPVRRGVAQEINSVIRNYVASKAQLGNNVCLAEVEGVYTEPDSSHVLFQDDFHPTAAGKAAIANAFLAPTKRAIDGQCASAPDITPPTASITSPASGATLTSATNVAVTATDSIGVSKVELYVDDTLYATSQTMPYSFSLNVAALTNGSHTLKSKAYDAANNIGTSPAVTVTIANPESTAPVTSITSPTSGSSQPGPQTTVTLTATDNIAVTKVELYVDGSLTATTLVSPAAVTSGLMAPLYTYTINSSLLPNGNHTLQSKAYDDAGNVGVSPIVSFTVATPDTTPPTTSVTSPTAGATVSGTIAVAASASDNVGVTKVEFSVDGVLKSTATTSPYTYSLDTLTLSNGTHTLQSKAYDAANNSASSSAVSVTVANADTTPPTTSVTAPTANTLIATSTTVSTSASDNIGVTKVEFYLDAQLIGADTTSPYSISLNPALYTNGSHTIQSKAYDAANNATLSASVPVIIDTVAPTVSITSPAANATVSGATVNVAVQYADVNGVTKLDFMVDGALKTTKTSPGTSPYSFTLDTTSMTNASHALSVIAYDAAGNQATSTVVSVVVSNVSANLPERLYASSITPVSTIAIGSAYQVETTQRINFTCAGKVNGVWWYRTSSDTGTNTVTAWRGSVVLAQAAANSTTTNGWAYIAFTTPINVTIGDQIMIGVHHPNGAYGTRVNGFTSRSVASASGCIVSPASTASAKNGMYAYSTIPVLPTLSYADSEYYIGPEFVKN